MKIELKIKFQFTLVQYYCRQPYCVGRLMYERVVLAV